MPLAKRGAKAPRTWFPRLQPVKSDTLTPCRPLKDFFRRPSQIAPARVAIPPTTRPAFHRSGGCPAIVAGGSNGHTSIPNFSQLRTGRPGLHFFTKWSRFCVPPASDNEILGPSEQPVRGASSFWASRVAIRAIAVSQSTRQGSGPG